jgi:hypothetical protein
MRGVNEQVLDVMGVWSLEDDCFIRSLLTVAGNRESNPLTLSCRCFTKRS